MGRPFSALEYEQYFWYVHLMAQTFEDVFRFFPAAENWRWTAEEQFRLHCGFFRGDDYKPELYSPLFQEIVTGVLADIPEKDCYRIEIDFERVNPPVRERGDAP